MLFLHLFQLYNHKVLPGYHFRDDAILLYDAIHKYVVKYVDLYYGRSSFLDYFIFFTIWGLGPPNFGNITLTNVFFIHRNEFYFWGFYRWVSYCESFTN